MPDLSGKVAFVTAGATGIGYGCAEAIVAAGGQVMICARREDTLADAAKRLGDAAAWVGCDVTDDASVDAAVAATVERFGKLDLAVNSAGTGTGGPLTEVTTAEFERVMDTNLTGAFRCLRAEAKAMMAGGGGSIVNISSIAGALTHP
jgi:NAD(P)-dependent dehydrogenase (short-subunit alcohol dehydrogenase family)